MRVFVVFIVLLIAGDLYGQENTVRLDTIDTSIYKVDAQDTIAIKGGNFHSPKRATIYEALVPGLGHIYNKKYWHVPITYAAFGVVGYLIVDNTKKYEKYRNAYEDFSIYERYLSQVPQYPLPIPEPESQRFREVLDVDYSLFNSSQLNNLKNAFRNNKDAFRRYRDLSYISLAVVYILNVIWATTDAHFFYYDVSDDLSLNLQPQMLVMEDYRRGVGLNIRINF